jgi:hypothetical protein
MSQIVNENYPKMDKNAIQEFKQSIIQEYNQKEIKKYNFPTEVISLPSKGLLYSEDSPLSNGTIELKYMTAQEEDILTTPSLIKQGIVLDKLFQALIVTPIKYNDLIGADKDAIMIASRILGYGKMYDATCTCPECTEESKVSFDLTTLEEKAFDPEIANMIAPNEFKFILPVSNREITFKLLTHGDEKKIQLELENLKKTNKTGINKDLTTRLKYIITSIDGNTDKNAIIHFVDNELFSQDSRPLREYIKNISPGVDFNVNFTCPKCYYEGKLNLPVGVDFFWPGA